MTQAVWNGRCSDLTITCDPHTFTVHRNVIAMHSEYFCVVCSRFRVSLVCPVAGYICLLMTERRKARPAASTSRPSARTAMTRYAMIPEP